jgi:sec-independent protein translocase protein TatB
VLDLSFGELLIIGLVLLVVVGPRELPGMLRKLGQGIAKLRNMSWQLREQSGIDQMLREEGLDKDLEAIRSLSKGRVVDAIMTEAVRAKPVDAIDAAPAAAASAEAPSATPVGALRPDAPTGDAAAVPPSAPDPSEPEPHDPEGKQSP